MRVLIVEDSRRLREALARGLRKAGYAIDTAPDGEEGLWFAESNDYDAIVLDLMLPKMDGLEVLRRLRNQGRDVHVLILTARDAVEDRVTGLESGADDYLVKPFAFEELLARLQALIRRSYGAKNPILDLAGLEIDTTARTVRRDGENIDLAPREYALLELLAMRRGEVVSRTDIERHIYDDRAEPMSNVVDAAIYSLRRKIDSPGRPSIIRTRRGMGYLLEAADSCDPSGDS